MENNLKKNIHTHTHTHIYVCITESLCWTPETNTTFKINYTSTTTPKKLKEKGNKALWGCWQYCWLQGCVQIHWAGHLFVFFCTLTLQWKVKMLIPGPRPDRHNHSPGSTNAVQQRTPPSRKPRYLKEHTFLPREGFYKHSRLSHPAPAFSAFPCIFPHFTRSKEWQN